MQASTRVFLNELADQVFEWCQRKGWNENLVLGNMISNLHTEISEAWEEIRNGHQPNEIYFPSLIPWTPDAALALATGGHKPEGFPVELADEVIRLVHICAYYGIDLEHAIRVKMAYNETRSHRHGGKTC